MPAFHDLRFRSSPYIELTLLGDLTAEQREPFRELERDPDFYGLFVPRPPLTMNLKSVAWQTAELFRALSTPSRLEPTLIDDDVIDLVLDGILEIESGDGFVSGADALPLVAGGGQAILPVPFSTSHEALLYAQDLETSDPHALTGALYLYNHIPASPYWKKRFPDRDAVLSHVGADRGTLRVLLERDWVAQTGSEGWLGWSSRTSTPRRDDAVTYKLYISPRPERIRDTFETVVRVLSEFPGTQFKIGDRAIGLLRADKLVAYFTTREQLGEAASALDRELAGCDPHGVPFTSPLDETGLLSWGVDPPDNDRVLSWLGRDSWRLWVVKRLGAALSTAKAARSARAVEPWRFAIERARRQGIDVETWTPAATLWSTP